MKTKPAFDDVLTLVEQLSLDERQTLVDILKHRIAEDTRAQIGRDIREARREFKEGKCREAPVDEIFSFPRSCVGMHTRFTTN